MHHRPSSAPRLLTSCLVGASLLSGCGVANVNRIFGSDDGAADTLFVEAQSAYDAGDFDRAQGLAERLLDRNDRNEAAAVLLGYINLSQGGIDPFRLARALIALDTKKKAEAAAAAGTTPTTGLADPSATPGGTTPTTPAPTTTTANASATETLKELSSIINLSDADFLSLQTGQFKGDSGLFADNPLLIPALVDESLRAKVMVLHHMSKAIKTICRFVDDSVKVGDDRDTGADCAQADASTKDRAKSHFLWAFSHLTEALVYQSVLLYSTNGATGSNLETAVQTLNHGTFKDEAGFTEFVAKVSDVKQAVDLVFNITPYAAGEPTPMITATLQDFDAVNRAFALLPGIPTSITQQVSGAMAKIRDVGQSVGTGVDGNASALKGQMTQKMAAVVGPKINTVIEEKFGKGANAAAIDKLPNKTAAEKAQYKKDLSDMCASYDKLAAGLAADQAKKSKPASCG